MTHGSLALHRLGSLSGGLASSFTGNASEDHASKLKRAKCTLDNCQIVGTISDINSILRAIAIQYTALPCGTTAKANY